MNLIKPNDSENEISRLSTGKAGFIVTHPPPTKDLPPGEIPVNFPGAFPNKPVRVCCPAFPLGLSAWARARLLVCVRDAWCRAPVALASRSRFVAGWVGR